MADMQHRRDPEEELVANAFSAYRASAPKNFPAPPAADVMAKAEKARPHRRALTVSLAAVAFTGLIAGGAAVAQTVASGGGDHVDRGDGNKSSTSDDGGGTKTSGPGDESSSSGDSDKPDDLQGLEITLPDWPNRPGKCPAGTYVFDDEGASEPKSQWSLTADGTPTTLDDDGAADDLIVQIDCASVSGVIALEHGEKETVSSKGFVDVAQGPGTHMEVLSVDGRTVTVDTGVEKDDGDSKETYVYDGSGFTEQPDDGPSDDPTSPSGTPSDDPTTTSPGSEPASD